MPDEINAVELATDLTVAWLANPHTRAGAEDVPAFLTSMHRAVRDLAEGPSNLALEPAPQYPAAVSVRKSLASKDYILSLIDGKPYKTLRRHLNVHGLTPDQYRERYGLKQDYPMVAESYAAIRRELAKKIGLSGRAKSPVADATPALAATPKRARLKVVVPT